MMEIEVNDFLYHLQCELWDLSQLNPSLFAQQAQRLIGTRAESQVIQTIRQLIHHYHQERTIMKYIYIIDKLLKMPNYSNIIFTIIPQLYLDVLASLLAQKCFKEIEQLKILRKYWVNSIPPPILKHMRDSVLLQTNIDIDAGFKPQTIVKIKEYYQNKLYLTPEQIKYHLPKVSIPQVKNAPNISISVIKTTQKGENGSINEQKRKRMASEQTRMSLEGNGEVAQSLRKKAHMIDNFDYRNILTKLKEFNLSQCRQCGKSYRLKKNFQCHINDHIQNKLAIVQKNRKLNKITGCTFDIWISPKNEIQMSLNDFKIRKSGFNDSYKCDLCSLPFQTRFEANQWVFINCTVIKSGEVKKLMHKSCHNALNDKLQ